MLTLILGGCRSQAPAPATPSRTGPAVTAPAPRGEVYPWSVVSGGVHSQDRMRRAVADDPVVAAHYSALDPDAMRPETLREPRKGYVSYRIGDKIFWTRRLLTLQAGETVLTGGKAMIRGRCGNLVSETPRQPVAPENAEPAEALMDQPVAARQLVHAPPPPAEPAIKAGDLRNPKQLGDAVAAGNVLPPPSAEEPLPPAWVTGGMPAGPAGVAAVVTAGGGPAGPAPPAVPSSGLPPESPVPTPPVAPPAIIPAGTTVPPPMVLAHLVLPPQEILYPPLTPPAIPGREIVPPVFPPPLLPPGLPFPPIDPPRITPPPGIVTPPPGGPPPPGPPPGSPPPGSPPPADPPSGPPPAAPPPDVPIPEPSAWVFLVLGIAGIAIGKIRRKT